MVHFISPKNLFRWSSPKVPVYGDGQQVRDWLHVRDHARAIDLIIHEGRIGEIYCVGGDGEKANIWIVKKLLEMLGQSEDLIEYVKDRAGHDRRYAINHHKITEELGWQPTITLEEGLRETVEWFQQNQEWWQKIKNGSYQEYYQEQYQER
jgi:dTDP-glucose 4,6-dehydratase